MQYYNLARFQDFPPHYTGICYLYLEFYIISLEFT